MSELIFFDLEGPLTPQDNAYELMKLIPRGGEIFKVISRYDDLLTLEGREGYEPGDTLALIAPLLAYHGITEQDISSLAQKAELVDGARELIGWLNSSGWEVFCISTSYEQYAREICRRVGIKLENLAATHFPLDSYRQRLVGKTLPEVEEAERKVLGLEPFRDDAEIERYLNEFFRERLPGTELGRIIKEVKPVGGGRKVEALLRFAGKEKLGEVVVVGDSITDFKMLRAVSKAGGLAIAFNANEYALPYATIGLASTNIGDLRPVLEAWEREGRDGVELLVRGREEAGGGGDRENLFWIQGREDLSEPLKIHKRLRQKVRREAGKLG